MGAERFVSKRRINRCTGAVRKQYLVCGKDIAKIKGKEAAEFRNHEVGFVFRAFNPVNEVRGL
jgi:ABC-type lipoprotein export system ATPase subunit